MARVTALLPQAIWPWFFSPTLCNFSPCHDIVFPNYSNFSPSFLSFSVLEQVLIPFTHLFDWFKRFWLYKCSNHTPVGAAFWLLSWHGVVTVEWCIRRTSQCACFRAGRWELLLVLVQLLATIFVMSLSQHLCHDFLPVKVPVEQPLAKWNLSSVKLRFEPVESV